MISYKRRIVNIKNKAYRSSAMKRTHDAPATEPRRGRPPKNPDAHRFVARIPPATFADLAGLANRAHVPINDLLVLAVGDLLTARRSVRGIRETLGLPALPRT